MSLLQDTLDKIEARAAKESAVALAQQDAILVLEMLAEMLRANGAIDARPVVTLHEYSADIHSPDAVTLRVLSFVDHSSVIDSLDKSGLNYTLEVDEQVERAIARIDGLAAYIEMVNYSPSLAEAA